MNYLVVNMCFVYKGVPNYHIINFDYLHLNSRNQSYFFKFGNELNQPSMNIVNNIENKTQLFSGLTRLIKTVNQ